MAWAPLLWRWEGEEEGRRVGREVVRVGESFFGESGPLMSDCCCKEDHSKQVSFGTEDVFSERLPYLFRKSSRSTILSSFRRLSLHLCQ